MMLSWHSLLSKLVILDFDFGCPRLRQYTSNRRCGCGQMDAPTPIHVGLAVWTLDFGAQIETNLFGVIIMTKAALPFFRERRAGHIIQVTSIAGRIGPIGRAPYAAAEFGVEGFSESLYKEVGPLGIKVTIVEPGGFRTDFAGSSTQLSEGRSEYDTTVGATVRFQRDYDGKQPGDPMKAAGELLHIASLSEPPMRL